MTRRFNAEFGGRSGGSKCITRALGDHKALADHNITAPLNALLAPLQDMDKEHTLGQRNIALSQNPGLLNGFNLNRNNLFDSIVRSQPVVTLSKDTLHATIAIPDLLTDINFFIPGKYPLFSITALLGIVPDLLFTDRGYQPSNPAYHILSYPVKEATVWAPTVEGLAATTLQLQHTATPPDAAFTLVLSIGIRFGAPGAGGAAQQIKYAGAAKVVGAV